VAADGVAVVTGAADASASSPWTEKVLIFRGSLLGIVPFPEFNGGATLGATLAADGGLPF
jgi:hypothetical protein